MLPRTRPEASLLTTIFLDRDGVINENRVDHVKSWDEFRFIPGALEAIAELTAAGLRIFVITNQAVVNRGIMTSSEVDAVNARMMDVIREYGGRVESVIYCPHRPEDLCNCRKPAPGLFFLAAERYQLNLTESLIIGDAFADIDAGWAAGCPGVLVLTGRGRDQLASSSPRYRDVPVVDDLLAASRLILRLDSDARTRLGWPITVVSARG
jgi:D-glycero-D-manno-heptose 1,7-bisphosphate phosphatase